MGRKKKPEEHENLERWLVSYADFITLLFATFVVLYALSQIDLEKFKDLKLSLQQAFSPTIFSGHGSDSAMMDKAGNKILNESKLGDDVNIMPPINPNLQEKKQKQVKEEIEKAVKDGKIKGIEVKYDKRGFVVSLLDNVFFDSGSSGVRSEAINTLDQVALLIKKNFSHNDIRIEGHTDSDPINSVAFPSNWELSAARASSVVRHFIKRFKMDKKIFSAVGYADARSIAPNDTPEGKKKNRRVEIVILNTDAVAEEAAKGLEETASEQPQKEETPKKEETIRIIKSSKGESLKDFEDKNKDPETTEDNSKTSTEKNKDHEIKNFNPIEMPVSSKKQRIVDVLTKVLDGENQSEDHH